MELSPVFPVQGLEASDLSFNTGIVFFKVMIASRNNGTFVQSCHFLLKYENINGQSPFLDILDNKTLYKKDAQS